MWLFVEPVLYIHKRVSMATTYRRTDEPRIDDLVQSVSLHNPRKWMFNGYILPFVLLQSVWIYCWVFVYGIDEYYEAGLTGIAAIGVLQIFLCLCCQWSVHIHTFLNCSSVSRRHVYNLFKQ